MRSCLHDFTFKKMQEVLTKISAGERLYSVTSKIEGLRALKHIAPIRNRKKNKKTGSRNLISII